jgi:NADPH:quinone reductase-like Zn-dependent oxidoreductase
MFENQALWVSAKRGEFDVRPAPFTPPGPHEIVVRNRAVAVNPVDRLLRTMGDIIEPWIKYPAVFGSDLAGEVVATGSAVHRFKVGDRVFGHAVGVEKARNRPGEGAFQRYTLLQEHMAAPIPDAISYEQASVLPLALSTAATGLFQKDLLGLRWPTSSVDQDTKETLIVWGGATSVGSNAIQLAVAAGYDVIATSSPHNFDYVRRLGASLAFDYRSETAIDDIISALRGKRLAGAFAIGIGSTSACIDILGASTGKRSVANASAPVSLDNIPAGRGRIFRLVPILITMLFTLLALNVRARRRGVTTGMIWGAALLDNEIGPMIYRDFIGPALAEGRFIAAPEAQLVGEGLEMIPQALEQQRKGVSARKLVVRL